MLKLHKIENFGLNLTRFDPNFMENQLNEPESWIVSTVKQPIG